MFNMLFYFIPLFILAIIATVSVFSLRGGKVTPVQRLSTKTVFKDRTAILTIIALAMTFVGNLPSILQYTYYLTLRLEGLIFILLELAPIVLLCLYFFIKSNNKNADRLVILTLASQALLGLTYNGTNIFSWGIKDIVNTPHNIIRFFNSFYLYTLSDIFSAFSIIAIIAASVLAFIGKSKNLLFKILLGIYAVFPVLNLLIFCIYSISSFINEELYLFLITVPSYNIGAILYTVVLWLVTQKQGISSFSLNSKAPKKITPEMQLTSLKEKFELGIITEEEYKAQRMEILNKI